MDRGSTDVDAPEGGIDEHQPETRAAAPSALSALPLPRWAHRMRDGRVELRGRVDGPAEVGLGTFTLRLQSGPLEAHFTFTGGREPAIDELSVRSDAVDVLHGEAVVASGQEVLVRAGAVFVDGDVLATPLDLCPGRFLERLLDRLCDVGVHARAHSDGELLITLAKGVRFVVPDGAMLAVNGATEGPPDQLRLCEPLVVDFGGEGMRLAHDQLQWLSRLAGVRLVQARLHPDGQVALEGRAARGIDLAIRAPLQRASARLSDLVRESPGLDRVRRFLKAR